jgi:hypothetical protein
VLPAAPRAKAGSKPNARNVNANSARGLRGKQPVTYKPQQSVAHTADDPVIERPPQGTGFQPAAGQSRRTAQ